MVTEIEKITEDFLNSDYKVIDTKDELLEALKIDILDVLSEDNTDSLDIELAKIAIYNILSFIRDKHNKVIPFNRFTDLLLTEEALVSIIDNNNTLLVELKQYIEDMENTFDYIEESNLSYNFVYILQNSIKKYNSKLDRKK